LEAPFIFIKSFLPSFSGKKITKMEKNNGCSPSRFLPIILLRDPNLQLDLLDHLGIL